MTARRVFVTGLRLGRGYPLGPCVPEVYDQVEPVILAPSNFMEEVPGGSVNMVLTFLSVHNLIRWRGYDAASLFVARTRTPYAASERATE